jgi:hypothetical protein
MKKKIESKRSSRRRKQKKVLEQQDMQDRRMKGKFYTPTPLANIAWSYITKELGEEFWLDGTWRIWDCACGEGGLAINVIPDSALPYLYMSSLEAGEVDYVKQHLPGCRKVWQMDFLNTAFQDFPEEIHQDLANYRIKWLFRITVTR